MVTFGFPPGFWALLAIPAVLAIHFLQRQSRRVVVSTLFLLETLPPESAAGRRFERLRSSVPLWLQLLSVLLLTWLLVQPRWIRRDSVQQVVIILDASVSMSAFPTERQSALAALLKRLGRVAATTEWKLVESDTAHPALYSGTNAARLLQVAAAWQPHLGAHDFAPAFAAAQTLLHGTGTIVFLTDRPVPVPEAVHLLAMGHPLENCGFAGSAIEDGQWRVLVHNYGAQPQRRQWWIESAGQKSPLNEVAIPPGQTATLTGAFPAGADRCEVVLTPDDFTWDDRVPILLPKPKAIAIAAGDAPPKSREFFSRLLASLPHRAVGAAEPDLRLAMFDPFHPEIPPAPAILFIDDPLPKEYLVGEIVAENHALTEGLNWSGLLCREATPMPAEPGDRTLVWSGSRPLVFLRPTPAGPLLVVNFDVSASNATRLPAFVLLLHRYVEEVRTRKVTPESGNFECHQALAVASDPRLPAPALAGAGPGPLRAPDRPGFFTVQQGNLALLQGAAQFADVREADFREAARIDQGSAAEKHLLARNTRGDFLAPVWLLGLALAMCTSWAWPRS